MKNQKNQKWWLKKDASLAAESALNVLSEIQSSQSWRKRQYLAAGALYGNSAFLGQAGGTTTLGSSSGGYDYAARFEGTYNAVQSIVDTVQSMAIAVRPRPYLLTSGGTWAQRTRAKNAQKFIDGLFFESHAYELGEQADRDSLVFGDGLAYLWLKEDGIGIERVPVHECWVDELEAIEGNARQFYRSKYVDRDMCREKFPDHEEIIDKAHGPKTGEVPYLSAVADVIQVTECWHLRSSPTAEDGKHFIFCSAGALIDPEPWDFDFLPVARLPYCKRMAGYWAQGLAEILQADQLEVNDLSNTISQAIRRMGAFKIINPIGSNVPDDHFTDEVDSVLHPTPGCVPEYMTPPAVSAQLYEWRRDKIQEMYRKAGVSELAASAQKPAGITAAVALDTLADQETSRFTLHVRNYERFYIQLAQMALSLLAGRKGGKNVKVRVPGKGRVEEIDWNKVKMDEKEAILQIYPTNALRKDPAGRLQDITNLIQAGMVSPWQGQKLIDFPDLEQVNVLLTASEEYVTKVLDAMCDEGIWTPPSKYDDPKQNVDMGRAYYFWGRTMKLEPARLAMLRNWIDESQKLIPVAPMPQPGPTQGTPAPAPQSPLSQNVPGPQQAAA